MLFGLANGVKPKCEKKRKRDASFVSRPNERKKKSSSVSWSKIRKRLSEIKESGLAARKPPARLEVSGEPWLACGLADAIPHLLSTEGGPAPPHKQVSLRMSRFWMVQRVIPGGNCSEALMIRTLFRRLGRSRQENFAHFAVSQLE
jgi:hypothetical protein